MPQVTLAQPPPHAAVMETVLMVMDDTGQPELLAIASAADEKADAGRASRALTAVPYDPPMGTITCVVNVATK